MESDSRHMWHKMTFKNPKMNDSGMYTVKVISKAKEEVMTYQLKVMPAKKKDGLKVGKGQVRDAASNSGQPDFLAGLRKAKKPKKEKEDENVWVQLRDAKTSDYRKNLMDFRLTFNFNGFSV